MKGRRKEGKRAMEGKSRGVNLGGPSDLRERDFRGMREGIDG